MKTKTFLLCLLGILLLFILGVMSLLGIGYWGILASEKSYDVAIALNADGIKTQSQILSKVLKAMNQSNPSSTGSKLVLSREEQAVLLAIVNQQAKNRHELLQEGNYSISRGDQGIWFGFNYPLPGGKVNVEVEWMLERGSQGAEVTCYKLFVAGVEMPQDVLEQVNIAIQEEISAFNLSPDGELFQAAVLEMKLQPDQSMLIRFDPDQILPLTTALLQRK